MKDMLRKLEPSKRRKALKDFRTVTPKTDDWLHDWVSIYLGVDISRAKVCDHHVAPFTAFANAFFARDLIAIWKASRGFGGKTMLLALLTLTEAITLGAYCNLLGGSGEQSQRVNAYLNGEDVNVTGKFLDAPLAPKHLLLSAFKREVRFSNGGLVRALMASRKSVRGPHPQRLRLDEIDEMELEIFDSSMGQTMSARGIAANTVCSSTHQHPDGTMTEAFKRAEENGWGVYEWCYRENLVSNSGWLEDQEVEDKKTQIPAAMWYAEYEGQEPNPQDRIFSDEVIENLFVPILGRWAGAPNQLCEVIPAGKGEYYHGADWAKKQDWTVIHTMKKVKGGPDRLAAWRRMGRTKWPDMVGEFNSRVEEYGGRAWHDVTGVGDVVNDYLTVNSSGLNFSSTNARDDALNKYISACESGEMLYPEIEYMRDEHKFLTVEDVYGKSGSGHLPDSVVAGALAWRARRGSSHGLLVASV